MHQATLQGRRKAFNWAQIGLSATLLVALSGALLTPAQAQPAGGRGMPGGPAGEGPHHAMAHRMGPGAAGGAMLSERLLDSVGASADQKARIQEIMGRARDDSRQQHQADKALHAQMMALMAAPQVDAAAAEGLRQQLQARRDTASKRHLQAMLDAGAVLTPEQRQKLAERARSHREMNERHHREREALTPRS